MADNIYHSFLGMELIVSKKIMDLIIEFKNTGELKNQNDWNSIISFLDEKVTKIHFNSNKVLRDNLNTLNKDINISGLIFNILPQYLTYYYLLFDFNFSKFDENNNLFACKVTPSEEQNWVRKNLYAMGNENKGKLEQLGIKNKLNEWLEKYLFHIGKDGVWTRVVGFYPKIEDISEILFHFTVICFGLTKNNEKNKVGEEVIKIISSYLNVNIYLTNKNNVDVLDFLIE